MINTVTEETHFQGPVSFIMLPKEFVDILKGTTPSVKNVRVFKTSGTVLTVTRFLDGGNGQPISILGDGNMTVSNNAYIKTNTAANKLLLANKIYRFTQIDNVWYEDA